MGDAFNRGDSISSSYNEQLARSAHNSKMKVTDIEGQTPRFYFDRVYNAHIGTFQRAYCDSATDNTITLSYVDHEISIEFDIKGDPKDERATIAPITQVRIVDFKHNINIACDYELREIFAFFHNKPLEEYRDSELDNYFASVPANALLEIPVTLEVLSQGRNFFRNFLAHLMNRIEVTIGEGDSFANAETRQRLTIKGLSDEMVAFLKNQKEVYDFSQLYHNFEFLPGAGGNTLEYIYAHVISQNVVYSIKDSGDYVSKTIHEFAEPSIQANENVKPFMQRWLKEFDLGVDYELTSIGGESHIVNIKSEDGKLTNLADKGMGAIQLIVLFCRLATIVAKKVHDDESQRVIIEEPEQNLHPSYQSKLADFFYIMNKEHKFRFLIETHSEYLIRKTQVLVKRDGLAKEGAENPFFVYYFGGDNADGKPYYQMRYRSDGRFVNKFGKGFFDEAANLAYEIF